MGAPRQTGLGANLPVPALVDLADELRALTEQMLRVPELSAQAQTAVAELGSRVRALTDQLTPLAPADRQPRMGTEPPGQRPFFVSGVILGDHHPLRPDLTIVHDGVVTHGTVRFGVTFEGPPGSVHGGFLAHFFDQILGEHNLRREIPAMTGTLSVRYLQATPILTELRFEVRHRADGERKVRTSGFLADGDELFSEAEGVFVIPKGVHWNP